MINHLPVVLFCKAEYPAACCVGSMNKAKPNPKKKIYCLPACGRD
jgi:hypothetical protein